MKIEIVLDLLTADGWTLVRTLGHCSQYQKIGKNHSILIASDTSELSSSAVKNLEKITGLTLF